MLGFGTLAKKVFGTVNDRRVKAAFPIAEKINALEPEFEALSDEGLIAKTEEFKKRVADGEAWMLFCPRHLQIVAKVPNAHWVCGPLMFS